MRRKILLAALLSTTAMVQPERAAAGPVIGFIAGAIGVPAGTAVALGINAGYAAGATFGASALGGFVVKTVLSLGLSAIAQALESKPNVPNPSDRMVNLAQPVSYAQWVFGRTRTGGPLGFTAFAESRRYFVPIIAAHPIEGIVEHWLDEWTAGVDETVSDFALPNIETKSDGDYTAPDVVGKYGRIEPFLGQAGQTANSGLQATFDEFTPSHDFASLSGAVIWAKRPASADFSTTYPRGQQWAWAPVVDGHNQIYDPRDETFKYTNNAALVMAYWLTEILGQQVDWDEVATEADVCDEQVTNAESESQPRWTINGVISDDQEFEQQRAQIAGACDAFLYERTDGKVGFTVGRWIEPDITLTADDFLSLEITEGQWGADAPSEIAVTYTEPDNAWRETPSGVWVEDASARRVREEPQLFLITNHNQAARMAKRLAKVKRPQYRLRGTLGLMGYELIGKRFARVKHDAMGIDIFIEIGRLRRNGIATFDLEAVSTQASDFAFDAETEEPQQPTYKKVGSTDGIATVEGVSATSIGYGAIRVDWTEADESLTQQIRLTDSLANEQIYTVPDGQRPHEIAGLVDGEEYDVEMRNRTTSLRSGAWAPDPPISVTVIANSNPPAALDSFGSSLAGSDVTLSWIAPNDPDYFATRIYRGTTDTLGEAALVHTEYGIPSASDDWIDEGLAPGTYYWWGVPINASGVEGPESGPESETVT